MIVRLPEVAFIDDKEGKPLGINSHIGRRPIAAFGNSDGDLQMLQWTTAGGGARFGLIVHHTDPKREWAYDRESHVGRLDKALDEAEAKADRFDREVEAQEEQLPTPSTGSFGGNITGTPEPETWVMLALTLIGLAYTQRRRLGLLRL